MTIRRILYGLTLLLFSCTNSDKNQNLSSDQPKETDLTYPTKELIIDNGEEEGCGADIRLSIASVAETDTSNLYTAISTYKDKKLGLPVSIPKQKEGDKGFARGIALKSIGVESDYFLQTLAKLYNQKADSSLKFTTSISVTYVNLDEFAKSLGATDGGDYKTQNQYKLFYEGSGADDYAELYLNISPTEHWIELKEKDEEYRPTIIRFLKK